MTNETIDSLTDFKISPKPQIIKYGRGKYEKLYVALKNLANDRAIEFSYSILEGKKFNNWRSGVCATAKKRGLDISAIQQNGSIFIFKK